MTMSKKNEKKEEKKMEEQPKIKEQNDADKEANVEEVNPLEADVPMPIQKI